MLPVYGAMNQLRLLEEIVFWKTQEMEHTEVIRGAIPGLEPPYVQLMQDWQALFAKTLEEARSATRATIAVPGCPLSPEWAAKLPRLVHDSVCQSIEFVRQLSLLHESIPAAWRTSITPTVIARIRRESEYFVGVMEELARTGAMPWNVRAEEKEAADGAPKEADILIRPEDGTWSASLPDAAAGGGAVPIGGHKLPPLPYSYKALEPWIDEKTMRIHHDKHHQSYVDGLNKAELKLAEARKTGDFELVKHWERELAFNGAGHYLHTLFWDVMSPRGGGKPSGPLAEEIDRSFGSYDAFKKQFTEAANKVEGGGWAILVWSPRSHRLEILTAEKHQNLSQWDVVPLLPLDVWEHAYYLKHQNDRAAYVRDWWNVVNWPYVAQRFAKARELKWVPY